MTPARRDHAYRDPRSVHHWLRRRWMRPRAAAGALLVVVLVLSGLPI